jgi:hypothetical protein
MVYESVKQETIMKQVARSDGFVLGLFFDHEDGGNTFLRNVIRLSTDYTVSYPRR